MYEYFDTDERADAAVTAWLGVFVFFVVGDVVTTTFGLSVGAYESHPVADTVLRTVGVAGMVAAKAFVVGVAWFLYRRAEAYPTAVPLSLAAMGVGITAWNTAVVAVLLAG